MSDLRKEIASAISAERFAAQPHELGFARREEVDRETDRIMRVVEPVARSRDAYRDERDQTQRERDLAVWLHAEAVWQRDRALPILSDMLRGMGRRASQMRQNYSEMVAAWRPAARPAVDREALLDVLKQADADYASGYRVTAYLKHVADHLIAAGYGKVEPLAEWQCPGCGATTRARMADHPTDHAAGTS